MNNLSSYDNRKWKQLGFADKMKFSLAVFLVLSSVIIGFVSFIMLTVIPTSVIGISGLWLSTALAFLGISSYFHNELVKFQARVNERLNKIDEEEDTNEIHYFRTDKS